ncbi:MAG: PAS domain S-box protein [Bacteroidales bacterium]|nr:PAS domain S-box protein [Bacteroidales bacterium]
MNYKLEDLIDISLLQDLQEKLNAIYSFPSAIIDNSGKILTAVAWQDICTKFHRQNPECEKECIKSDQYILDHLNEASPAVSYQCPQGLIDNAAPIIIDGQHLGNFFTGQFFLEKPNLDFFRQQAKKYGFDENYYLEAVKKVPVWTKEQLHNYLDFIKGFIEVIASIGLKNLNEKEYSKKLEEREVRFRTILQIAMDGFLLVNNHGKILEVNKAYCDMSGYTENELLQLYIFDLDVYDTQDSISSRLTDMASIGKVRFLTRHLRKDKTTFDAEVSVQYNPDFGGMFVAFIRNVTEQKKAEQDLLEAKEKAEENETRFKALHNASFGGILIHDKGLILDCNEGLARITGYSVEELIGMDGLLLLTEEFRGTIRHYISIGYEKPYEVTGIRKNGEQYPVRIESRNVTYKGIKVRTTEFRDISEEKNAENGCVKAKNG